MRDAMAIWRDWTARPWAAALITLVFAAPFLSGTLGRLLRGRTFFAEYESVACAGQRLNAGLSPYGADFACAGMNAQPFVYLPWVAESAAAVLRAVGPDVMRWGYVALYLAACAVIAWIVFWRAETPGARIERAPFLALITGSALTVGNVAIPITAAILLTALALPRRPLVFIAVVAAAGAVKPFQLTYLILLPLALGGPLWRRALYSALGGAAGLGVFALALNAGNPALFEGWREAAQRMALDVAPGEGFLGWIFGAGLSPPLPALAAAYAVFAAAIGLSALALAERASLGKDARIFLGVSVATLLTPRLMQIDFLALGPGLLAVVAAAAVAAPHVRTPVSWLVYGACFAALLLGIADLGDVALKIATGLAALSVLVAGAAAAAQSTARR
ncbi:MAG: hypothetical protein KJS97_05465 [Alphaproteobacteria bacterium]|nr:hypothetical protein [Alphaproteobacteria bacterium]